MKKCTVCKTLLPDEAVFCAKCGTFLDPPNKNFQNTTNIIKCSCGTTLNNNTRFCPVCGLPVILREQNSYSHLHYNSSGHQNQNMDNQYQQVVNHNIVYQQQIPQNQYQETKLDKGSKKKNKSFLKIVFIIFISTIIIGGGYFLYTHFFRGISKKLLTEQKIYVSEKDQTISYKDEILVTVPYGILDSEATMRIYSVKGLPDMSEGVSVMNAFDIDLGEKHQFDGFLEIAFNYNASDIPSGLKPSEALTCMSYDEKSKQWIPVPFIIDESKNKVVIFTKHLSIFATGITGEKIQPGPMMSVKTVKFPGGNLMDEQTMIESIQKFKSLQGSGSKEGIIAGWDFINEWFGITGNASSFAENALEVGSLEGVNKIATEVGLAFALVQAGIDFSNGKNNKAVLELTKNLSNYSTGKIFNTTAMNIAMIGVFAIDYSLNKFANTAISGRNDIYQKAYDMYYADKRKNENINSVWWYKNLLKIARNTKNTNEAGGNIDKFMHDYVYEFWKNPEIIAIYLDKVGLSSTGFGGLNENLKKEISETHLNSIVYTLHNSGVFDKLIKQLKIEAMGKLYDQLCLIQAQLNRVNQIKVIIKPDPECSDYKDIELGGLKVEFEVSNIAHKELWKGETNKDGVLEFRCTNLGYLDAGAPKLVKVIVKGPSGKDEEFTGKLKLIGNDKTSIVEIIIGAPKLEGTWKLEGTITSISLDASLQYMDQMADFYGSGDEYRKERKKVTDELKGQKVELPELKLDGIEYIMDVKREGNYYIIQSKRFNDKNTLGGVQYKIRFIDRNTLEGTYIGLSYFNGKENRTEMNIIGKRLK